MANPLHRAAVFLGLAEEEGYDEQQYVEPQRHAPVAVAPAPRQSQVTPLRRVPAAKQVPGELNEILTVHPRVFKDVQVITDHYREGVPVIINISQMPDSEARRLLDFCGGLSQALYGRIEKVTGKVFLLSPSHVAVSGEQHDTSDDLEASFFGR